MFVLIGTRLYEIVLTLLLSNTSYSVQIDDICMISNHFSFSSVT